MKGRRDSMLAVNAFDANSAASCARFLYRKEVYPNGNSAQTFHYCSFSSDLPPLQHLRPLVPKSELLLSWDNDRSFRRNERGDCGWRFDEESRNLKAPWIYHFKPLGHMRGWTTDVPRNRYTVLMDVEEGRCRT